MQVTCPECETVNPESNKFCSNCGAPLAAANSQQETPPVGEQPKKRRRWLPIAIAVVALCAVVAIIGALLSGPSDEEATPTVAAVSEATKEVQPTEAAQPTELPIPADTEQPTEPPPTDTPEPTPIPPTSTPEPIGLGRSNPYPRTEVVSAPGWDVQVLEIVRGNPAWQAIQAANQFNDPPPAGMEYLLVKLHVKCTYDDSEEHLIGTGDFKVTGDRYERYSTAMAVEPEPQLDAQLYSGGETEGWVSYLVGQGESNMILIVDELMNFSDDRFRYVALEDGASLTVPPELDDIESTEVGTDRADPAPFGETVITEDWQLSILEVFRGDEAWNMVSDANQFNDPPEEGMEYVLVHVQARNIGTQDEHTNISGAWFNSTGSENVLYDLPMVVDPDPVFDCYLYPGGECVGWVTLQAAQGEPDLTAVFEPIFEFTDESKRFLSLVP